MPEEAQIQERGESALLEVDRSWFSGKLKAAGFPSVDAFAKEVSVPKSTAYQWQRGCAANPPTHRPPARLMPLLANKLGVSLVELLERLWGEKVGDPCPCDCGGYKRFEHAPPEARTLAIVIPCAKCGTTEKRIYKRWKKGRHRKLCEKCGKSGERAEYTVARCRTCNRIKRRPSSYFEKRSSFDPPSNTYQCNNCGSLERMNARRDRELREIEVEETGQKRSQVKIRTRQTTDELFRKRRQILYGGKLRTGFTPEEQERGRQRHVENAAAGTKYLKKTASNLVRRWDKNKKELPTSIGFGICIFCRRIEMSFVSAEPNFHKACHDQWERTEPGRRYQRRVMRWGKAKASLPGASGLAATRQKLKLHYSWTIKWLFADKGYGTIAKENGGINRASINQAITDLIDRLPPPELLAERFQISVKLILQAAALQKRTASKIAGKLLLEATAGSIS